MEFHQLRYFIAAAEDLSVTSAARRLHISQPALSRQIHLLEDELGVLLFDRVKKRIRLTDAGKFFLDRARQIVCDVETTVQQVREQFGEAKRTIRLGFLTLFLDDIVSPALKELRKRKIDIRVSFFELSARAQLDRLRNDELDVALVGNLDEEDRERLSFRCIARTPMGVVIPEEHPLAKRKQIVLEELADDPFVSLAETAFPGRRQFLRSACQSRGFEPNIVEESDSVPLMIAAVSSGAGVALVPMHSRKVPHAGSVFVRLKVPKVYAEIFAAFKIGKDQGLIHDLVSQMEEEAQKIDMES